MMSIRWALRLQPLAKATSCCRPSTNREPATSVLGLGRQQTERGSAFSGLFHQLFVGLPSNDRGSPTSRRSMICPVFGPSRQRLRRQRFGHARYPSHRRRPAAACLADASRVYSTPLRIAALLLSSGTENFSHAVLNFSTVLHRVGITLPGFISCLHVCFLQAGPE